MLYRGSYLNGFAPRDVEPAYPELWRGCVGAWCPSLGPTGGVLRDWSGAQNHGTLTNATLHTMWANSRGYSLLHDGSDDSVITTFAGDAAGGPSGAAAYSISLWANVASAATYQFLAGWYASAAGPSITTGTSTDDWLVSLSDSIYGNVSKSSITDGWHHLCMVYDGSQADNATRLRLFVDGDLQTLSFTGTVPATLSAQTTNFTIGNKAGWMPLSGSVDDIRLYSRALTHQDRLLLYSNGRGRGIAYSYNQPRGSLTADGSSASSGSTFPGAAWWALKRWRFVVRAGVDGNWPRVT